MSDFDIWHDYQRAKDQGLIDPILCPDDQQEVFLKADGNFEPILHCHFCQSSFYPTFLFKNLIKQQLKEITVE